MKRGRKWALVFLLTGVLEWLSGVAVGAGMPWWMCAVPSIAASAAFFWVWGELTRLDWR